MQTPPPPPDQPPSPGGYTAFPPPPGGHPPPSPPPPVAAAQWQPPPQAAAAYGYPAQPYGYAPYAPQGYVQVQFAGFWVRVIAYIIDRVILGVIGFVFGIVIGFVGALANPNGGATQTTQSSGFTWLLYLVLLLIELAYFAGRWSLSGATVGQRLMGLRVVDAQTLQPISPTTAIIRWVGMVISFLVCYLGVIWVAFDGRKQGWHDKMASTVVIHG